MSATELFASNRAVTTVSSGGTDAPSSGTTETWTVASSSGFGAAATGVSQFHVADPQQPGEIIAVTNVSGTTWTVTRGAESTTPAAHVTGFTVYQVVTAGFLSGVTGGGGGGGSGTVTSVTATDTSIVVSGTDTVAPTIATGTLDVIATQHPPAGNWSNNSHKITSLANGSGAQDAAAFGQLPSSGTPLALTEGGTGVSESSNAALLSALGAAPLASPTFTGTPAAPTASALTDSTQVATTAYTDAAVAVETSRAEAAEALKAPLASPALTGSPTAPTKSALTNNTDIATTAYADAAVGVETSRAETAEAAKLPLAGGTMTGWLAPAVVALTFSSTIAVNAALGNVFTVTLTASTGTIENPSNPVDGQVIRFRVAQDSTGGRTVAWGSAFDWGSTSGSANSAPALTATASKTDTLGFEYDAAATAWTYLGATFPQGF